MISNKNYFLIFICFARRNVHTTYFFLSITCHLFSENVIDIRRQLLKLNEQSQGRGSEKLTKRQCQTLYPDGNDSTLFFEIEEKLGSLSKAETLLVLCKYDFTLARSIAEEAASLFHCNMKLFKSLYEKFDKDANKVMEYLRKFKNHQPQDAETTHCKAALETLQSFRGDGIVASDLLKKFRDDTCAVQTFLSNFDANGEEASSFLSSFENNVERTNNFLHKFNDKVENANKYLKKFANVAEGETFLQKFTDGNEANEFAQVFNGSFDRTSQFIKSFDNTKEALEHLEKIKKECDKKADNSCGDNCKWIFDEKTKTLFIRGSGKMKNYGWHYEDWALSRERVPSTPWYSIRKQIKNVVISEGITTIKVYAFSTCSSLTSITIPNSVTTIEGYAFRGCSLTSIAIPNSVTAIGGWTFIGCSSLTAATLPKRFASQKDSIFYKCDNLKTINWT